MRKQKKCENMLVNKTVFLSSIYALGIYLEGLSELFEEIKIAKQPVDYKTMLAIVANHIDAVSKISQGFEASLELPIDPDKSKGLLN